MRLLRRVAKAVRNPGHAFRIAMLHVLVRPGLDRWAYRLGGTGLLAQLTARAIDPAGWRPDRRTVLVLDRLFWWIRSRS